MIGVIREPSVGLRDTRCSAPSAVVLRINLKERVRHPQD
jgi:hypothetical protein